MKMVNKNREEKNSVPKPGPGRVAQRNRTRRAIVEAAKKLMESGASPSMAEIAEAAEVSRRTLYMYFRNSDITSTTAFQPGTSENWLNTLFYDPCQAGQVCTGPGGIFGPAGAPYIQSAEGQLLLEDSGVTPLATEVCTDITTSTAC